MHTESSDQEAPRAHVLEALVALELDSCADSDQLERRERLEQLSRQLRSELARLDIDSIDAARHEDAPAGAKGAEVIEWGTWLLTLSASGGVLTSVIAAAREWVARRADGRRVKIIIGGDTLELDDASDSQQSALVDAFVRRHVGR